MRRVVLFVVRGCRGVRRSQILRRLRQKSHGASMDIRQEIAAHVQTLARRGKGKAGAMKQAAKTLRKLSERSDANKDLIVAAGAVKGLVALLGGNSADGKESAARALQSLASNKAAKEAMVREGAISPLVALARDGGRRAKESAADALYEISTVKSENAVKIVQAGGIEVLIALARDGGDDDYVGASYLAACAVCYLSSYDETKVALVVADAIPLLLDIVRNDLTSVKLWIVSALEELGVRVDKSSLSLKQAFSKAEIRGIPLLFKLARDGSPSVKKQAEDLLRTLVVNDEYAPAIEASKAEAELIVAEAAVDEARSRRDDRVRESAKAEAAAAKAASLRDDAETALKRAEAAASEARSRRDDWLRFQNAALQAKVDELERRPAKKQRTDLETCVICLDAPRAMVLFPCAHACLCAACGGALESCPICRADVANRAAIILS